MGHLGIEPTGPTAGLYRDMTRSYAGGWRSFLGGMGQPLASLLDLASCASDALQCARDQATASTYSALYLHWLHSQGVLTGASSWFGAGAGTTDFTTAMLGSMAGGTETATTGITDLAPEAGTGAVSGGVRSFSARWPGGSPFFSAVRSAGGSWQVTRGVAQDVGSASAGAPATYAAQIAEEDEAGVSGVLKDPQNLIDAGNQMFNDVVQPALPQGTPYAVTHASWGDPLLGACVAAAVIIKMRGCP